MKKRILQFLLAAAMVLGLVSTVTIPAMAAEGHGSHDGWTVITENMGDSDGWLRQGEYVLTDNVKLNVANLYGYTNAVYPGETVTICLNGYTLDVSKGAFYCGEGSTLNICDCSETKGKIFTDGTATRPDNGEDGIKYALWLYGGTATLENCVVEFDNSSNDGIPAIYASSEGPEKILNLRNCSVLLTKEPQPSRGAIDAYNTTVVNVSDSTIDKVVLYDSASIYLEGNNAIGEIHFGTDQSVGKVYVTDSLTAGSSIGLSFYDYCIFPFTAVEGSDYTITNTDASCFHALAELQAVKRAEGNNNALAVYTVDKLYDVTAAETTGGTVSFSTAPAAEGVSVTVIATPDEGYELDTLTAATSIGGSVEMDANNTFIMPAYDVTVTATFKEKIYPITIGAVDADDNSTMLKDVVLEIYNSNNKVLDNWTSGFDGNLLYTVDLTAGTYTLKNIVAATGYSTAANTQFTIGADGTVTVSGNDSPVIKDSSGNLLVQLKSSRSTSSSPMVQTRSQTQKLSSPTVHLRSAAGLPAQRRTM